MGKSLGNVVKPLEVAETYGRDAACVDAVRYILLREMTPGLDADYNQEKIAARYTADLANNLCNLLQRITSMIARYCGGSAAGDNLHHRRRDRRCARRLRRCPGRSSP